MSEEMNAEYWEEVEKFMGKRISPEGIDDPYKDCLTFIQANSGWIYHLGFTCAMNKKKTCVNIYNKKGVLLRTWDESTKDYKEKKNA